MANLHDDLASFHQFALARLSTGSNVTSLDELLVEWRDRHDREAVNAGIRRGLTDVEQGRYESADELDRQLRQDFGLPGE